MDYAIFRYLRDNIRGFAAVDRTRSISLDIVSFEEEMEWQVYDIADFWMDHEEELVDHELGWMTLYYSNVANHRVENDCAKFQI